MSGFKLDTSGSVRVPRGKAGILTPTRYTWETLPNDFARGYIARAIEDVEWPDPAEGFGPSGAPRFDWLAPATLAAMLEDCERALRPGLARDRQSQDSGAAFWALRQRGTYADPRSRQPFPPVQISLADDGKIHQREGGR